MLGHGMIGVNAKKAGVFEAAKAPFMMQNTGGAITRAMNAHMSSCAPTTPTPPRVLLRLSALSDSLVSG